MVIVLGTCGRDLNKVRSKLRCGTRAGKSHSRRSAHAVARQSSLKLLIGSQTSKIDGTAGDVRERNRSCDPSAVISPIESKPWSALPGLILQVRCLIKLLIMIDAEDSARSDGVAPAPPSCGRRKRAATLEKTIRALNPWRFGTLILPAKPGILELCHSIFCAGIIELELPGLRRIYVTDAIPKDIKRVANELQTKEFAQAFGLGAADRNFRLFLVVHTKLIGTLKPGHNLADTIDINQIRAMGAPEKISI